MQHITQTIGSCCKGLQEKSYQKNTSALHLASMKNYNRSYFFDCLVNGVQSRAYVDSGCDAVMLKESEAHKMEIMWKPANLQITGFAGGSGVALGYAKIKLSIDEAKATVTALIVPDGLLKIPLIVGQAFLNQPHVTMIVSGYVVRIYEGKPENLQPRKIVLWAVDSTVVPSKTTIMLAVTSKDEGQSGEVFVQGGLKPVPGKEYFLEDCLTNTQDGVIAVTNLSNQEIVIPAKKVLARGVPCQVDDCDEQEVRALISTVQTRQNFSIEDVNYGQGLNKDEKRRNDTRQKSFDDLKDILVERPILAIYDPLLRTEVHTDASKVGIGGILLQEQNDHSLKPIMYFSRQTSKEEQRYHSYELETLAVVASLKAFHLAFTQHWFFY